MNLSISGLRHVKNSMNSDFNETRPSGYLASSAVIHAPTQGERSLKYTNRRLLDGGKSLTFPRFRLNGSVVYLNREQHEAK